MEQIVNLLANTFNPNTQIQKQSELELKQASSQAGFMQVLLQIIMMNQVQIHVRQAASIYLKNYVHKYWQKHAHIAQDKPFLKQNILQAVVHAPQQLKYVDTMTPRSFVFFILSVVVKYARDFGAKKLFLAPTIILQFWDGLRNL